MFKEILLELLAEKGISQRKLSRDTGIPPTTISGWINAGRLPDYSALRTLRIYFDVTADYLLGLEDETGSRIYKSIVNTGTITNNNINIKWYTYVYT